MKPRHLLTVTILASLLMALATTDSSQAGETTPELPPIRLTGFTAILGTPRALLVVAVPGVAEQAHVLKAGETAGDMQLLTIDERAKAVQVRWGEKTVRVGMESAPDLPPPSAPASPAMVSPVAVPSPFAAAPPALMPNAETLREPAANDVVVVGRRSRDSARPQAGLIPPANPPFIPPPGYFYEPPLPRSQPATAVQPQPVTFQPTPLPEPVPVSIPIPVERERLKINPSYPPLPPTSMTPSPGAQPPRPL